jgi:hypothetical protein
VITRPRRQSPSYSTDYKKGELCLITIHCLKRKFHVLQEVWKVQNLLRRIKLSFCENKDVEVHANHAASQFLLKFVELEYHKSKFQYSLA